MPRRRGAAHDVPLDVAAGGQRRKLHFVDTMDRVLPLILHHAVQLQTLAARDPQRRIAHLVAQVELGQKLIAGQLSAGNFRADHERVDLGRLSFPPVRPTRSPPRRGRPAGRFHDASAVGCCSSRRNRPVQRGWRRSRRKWSLDFKDLDRTQLRFVRHVTTWGGRKQSSGGKLGGAWNHRHND